MHDEALIRSRLKQDRMQRCDDRHPEFAQKSQDMTASCPAEYPELVLETDDINVADIEKVGGSQIGREILLFNLETNDLRVFVT